MTYEQIQLLLAYLGYYDSRRVDGLWGPASITATERFQRDYGLMVDGIAGASTQKALKGAVAETMPPINAQDDFWAEIKHFSREEFRCKCGGLYCNGYPAEMQEAVVKIADAARAHFGNPAHVVSGLRCRQWNAHEGGVANSQHMYGEAIDLRIDGVDSETLRQFVSAQPGHRYSYCINSTNVHFDINKVGR